MDDNRYTLLMRDEHSHLSTEEIESGWHFCSEWDGLLIGPEMREFDYCSCNLPEFEK